MTLRLAGLAVPGCEGFSTMIRKPTYAVLSRNQFCRELRALGRGGSKKVTNDDEGEGGGHDTPQKWWRHLWTAPKLWKDLVDDDFGPGWKSNYLQIECGKDNTISMWHITARVSRDQHIWRGHILEIYFLRCFFLLLMVNLPNPNCEQPAADSKTLGSYPLTQLLSIQYQSHRYQFENVAIWQSGDLQPSNLAI